MRRKPALFFLTFLLLAFLPSAVRAEVLTCPEQNFATEVNFDCTSEYQEGDGLYIYTVEQGCIPYVLVFVNTGEGRSRDGAAALRDVILPDYEETYSPNGPMQMSQYENFFVGGRSVAAADVEYRNANGLRIFLLTAVDVRENYTAVYRVRYTEPSERQGMLNALGEIAMNLRLLQTPENTGNQSGGGTQTDGGSQNGGGTQTDGGNRSGQENGSADAGETEAVAYTINGIEKDGMIFGRCMVPEGYDVTETVASCTTGQSTSNPYLLRIEAYKPGEASLTYYSPRDFLSNVNEATEDGTFSMRFFTPWLHYMTAAEYCNYWAAQVFPDKTLTLVEEYDYPEAQPYFRETERKNLMMNDTAMARFLGLTFNGADISMCTRRYEYEADDVTFTFCVTAVSSALQMTMTMPGLLTTIKQELILWNVPCLYAAFCPASQWEKVRPVFDMFRENTSASDQFFAANRRCAEELWRILVNQTSLSYAASYSEEVMRDETGSGDDYDEERFTDYLYDQNDYTLSDGSHVKVPTSYGYVYEGDNGNVYVSDSAFGQPGGTTQLYPNQ